LGRDRPVIEIDEAKSRRLKELESLLNEYKSRNDALMKDLDVLGQGSSFRRGRTWEELAEEAERERHAKQELQKGRHILLLITCSFFYLLN
jgi:hypothetical protein